ncbi:protein RESTRICTED TEV MOVEMENT 3-like [Neltuma alba]|uniref:protein RESTRICTED TEV MOVEMENT 3-like n=1 Tax=Neltuma alba TaxID=207710 RepID=UPI0010A434AF|nr:protein RESTRICTED TEV MOVEMENT 3-like [Prosopis alba]
MKNQEPKDLTCKKVAWTISNFSSLKINAPHYSEIFAVGDCAWRLLIYRGKIDGKSFAIYLEVADASSLRQGWSILAAFSLTVVNQVSRTKSLTKGDADVPDKFCADSYSWGYKIFMPLSELGDPTSGYILNDKCIVEVELFSVTFEGIEPTSRPTHPSLSKEPKDVESKDDDVVDFKDLGKIEKKFVPLLEEVCSWHPSLMDCQKNKSRKFTEWVFTALGRVLQFLKGKKWKDMNEEACEKLRQVWEELEMSRLDLSWLEPLVKSAVNMKGYDEKAEKVKKLKQNLVVVEAELKTIKEKLASTEQRVEMARKELVNAEQDFEEKDLDAKIGYGKP